MSTATTPGPFGQYAERLRALGYTPLPLAGKRPVNDRWQELTPNDVARGNPGANVGIATRGLAALDADILDKRVADHMRHFVARLLGGRRLMFRVGAAPKWLCLLRCAEGELPKRSSPEFEDAQGRRHRLEWLRAGQQFLAFGAHPDTLKAMRWPHGSPLDNNVPAAELPAVTEAQIDAINAEFVRVAEAQGWTLVAREHTAAASDAPAAAPVAGLTLEHARDALTHYPNDELPYDEWLAVGMALHHQFEGDAEAFAAWVDWSRQEEHDGGTPYAWQRWQSFHADRPGGVSMRSTLMVAEGNGWERPAGVESAPAAPDEFPDLAADEPEAPPEAPGTDAADVAAPKPAGLPGGFQVAADFDAASMPLRDWVVPGNLLAGHVSLLVGPPGTAKSALDLTRAIAIVTGRELLGERIAKPGPVLVVNNEDPRDEIERRVVGICARYRVPLRLVAEHLHLSSGYEAPIKFAEIHGDRHSASLRPTKDASRLLEAAERLGLVAIIADPLISTVRGGEENSNDRMEELVSIWKRIASRTGAAVGLTHHTKKTGRDSEAHAGDMEAARGGGALIGAVRMAFTLARMSAENGAARGLPRGTSKRLIRLDDAKQNYWLHDEDARWFYLESVPVGNGESVGVPVPADLEAVQEEHGTPEDMSVEALTNDAQRGLLVQLYAAELDDQGLWSGPLRQVADRWMSHADCKERQALEQCKRLIPEGGSDHAVTVDLHGVGYRLWRTALEEGSRVRHVVYVERSRSDTEAWAL